MELDYEKDMQIDQDALDIEWLEQPSLALKYGRHVADLRKEVNKLEEKKKTVRSELIMEANSDPEGCCDKSKPNEKDIEAYYRTHQRYKASIEELLDAKYELEFAEIAKNEISFTRKNALENMVKLYIGQYFAGPSVPRDLSKEWEAKQKQKRVNSKIGAKMKRTRE